MSVSLTPLDWRRIVSAALTAFIASIVLTMLIAMAYAFVLGFQVHGQPDAARIKAFGETVGPLWGPLLLGAFTAFAAMWVARRSTHEPLRQGTLVGVVAATAGLIPSWPLRMGDVAVFIAIAGAGWLGAVIGARRGVARLPSREGS